MLTAVKADACSMSEYLRGDAYVSCVHVRWETCQFLVEDQHVRNGGRFSLNHNDVSKVDFLGAMKVSFQMNPCLGFPVLTIDLCLKQVQIRHFPNSSLEDDVELRMFGNSGSLSHLSDEMVVTFIRALDVQSQGWFWRSADALRYAKNWSDGRRNVPVAIKPIKPTKPTSMEPTVSNRTHPWFPFVY
jgi:hypothetical protein